jgi:proline iminopeptidase
MGDVVLTERPALEVVDVENPDGYRLVCDVSGTGDTTVLALHGGPGGGSEYLRPIHRLSGSHRRLVTFDQLGTGRSAVPSDTYEWSVERAAADVDAVRAGMGVDQVDVLGHSWGGMLALQYVLDFPTRVRRLVLSNTVTSTARMTAAFLRQVLEVAPIREAAAALTADALGDHTAPEFITTTRAWLATYMTGDSDAVEPQVAEIAAPDAGALGLWGTRLWFADGPLRTWDVEDRLGEIAAPTLAIHGGRDASDASINRVLAEGIRSCTWVTLQLDSHDSHDGPHANAYLSIVDSFLNDWHRTEG